MPDAAFDSARWTTRLTASCLAIVAGLIAILGNADPGRVWLVAVRLTRSGSLSRRNNAESGRADINLTVPPTQQALDVPTNLDIALFLGAELTKMMIRVTVTESAPFLCRQGAKQRMVS